MKYFIDDRTYKTVKREDGALEVRLIESDGAKLITFDKVEHKNNEKVLKKSMEKEEWDLLINIGFIIK